MFTTINAGVSNYYRNATVNDGIAKGTVAVGNKKEKDATKSAEVGVSVKLSVAGLSALENIKGQSVLPDLYRELPKDMQKQFDWSDFLSEKEKKQLDEQHCTDHEAVMKMADPEAFEEYKTLEEKGRLTYRESGSLDGHIKALQYLVKWFNEPSKHDRIVQAARTYSESSEAKLSNRAFSYLKDLRKNYVDYDFIVADTGDDRRALLKQSNKDISVIFSREELERMSRDKDYAAEKMRRVQTIVHMTDRICQEFGYERAWDKRGTDSNNGVISKMAASFDDDGKMNIFAELEKSSEKQREHIEKMREMKADDEKAAEKKAEKEAERQKNSEPVKRIQIEAESEDDLYKKISEIDRDKL